MHILVTGASSGIGEAIARAYGLRGHTVTVVARREEKLRALKDELTGRATVEVLARDLADPGVAAATVAEAEARQGPLDVLVNNAGVQIVDEYDRIDAAALMGLLHVNLTSPMLLTHAALQGMRARRRGTVVHVASVAAYAAPPGMAAYAASKTGIAAFSEVLASELQGSGVHVVTVYPGPVRTPMGETGQAAYEESWTVKAIPWGTAEGLADRVLHAVDKRRRRVTYPRTYGPVRHFSTAARPVLDTLSPPLKGKS